MNLFKLTIVCCLALLLLFSFSNKEKTNDSILSLEPTTHIIETLASDEMRGRATGSLGFNKSADFIIDEYLSKHKYHALFGSVIDTFSQQNFVHYQDEFTLYNIVAVNQKFNKHQGTVVISAHLDHLGTKNETIGNDKIYNGANDNASGVAAAIQIATFLKQKNINKNIILAITTGEEHGLLGSKHLAKKLKQVHIKPELVLNFDMIGNRYKNGNKILLTGSEISNLKDVINGYSGKKFVYNAPNNTFFRSDNYPFFQEFDIPAHTFITFDESNYKHYHLPSDEVEQIDLEHTNDLINNLATIIHSILSKDVKIKRTKHQPVEKIKIIA